MLKPRWTFTEHTDGTTCWKWTRHLLDGGVDVTSKSFDTYGGVITDALNAGFQPVRETWAVKTVHGTSIFNGGLSQHQSAAPGGAPPNPGDVPTAAKPSLPTDPKKSAGQ